MSRPLTASERVSKSLRGKYDSDARRWKGSEASYAAKHMWIAKHYGKATFCENDPTHKHVRYEWANISGKHKRERSDYRQLCKSCHGKFDRKNSCRNGHPYTDQNTRITKEGWRRCRTCHRLNQRAYVERTSTWNNA